MAAGTARRHPRVRARRTASCPTCSSGTSSASTTSRRSAANFADVPRSSSRTSASARSRSTSPSTACSATWACPGQLIQWLAIMRGHQGRRADRVLELRRQLQRQQRPAQRRQRRMVDVQVVRRPGRQRDRRRSHRPRSNSVDTLQGIGAIDGGEPSVPPSCTAAASNRWRSTCPGSTAASSVIGSTSRCARSRWPAPRAWPARRGSSRRSTASASTRRDAGRSTCRPTTGTPPTR